MSYQKNDIITVTIEDMGMEGEGIGKVDGFTLFVKDAVIGDTVEAKIMKSKAHYAYARLEKVLQPSPFRVQPQCVFHRQCGGCQIQALSYEKQLAFKQDKIRNNLIRIGGFAPELIDSVMEPIVGMEEPFHYRNKAQYPVGTDKDSNPITGFYAGRTHSIIANTDCALGAKENQGILECILDYMKKNHVSAYDETTGKGLVRHVLIRTGFTSGEIMVCLVINYQEDNKAEKKSRMSAKVCGKNPAKKSALVQGEADSDIGQNNSETEKEIVIVKEFLPRQQELLDELQQLPGMKSISVSINTEKTNVIMGKEIHTLWGTDTISDTIHVRDMEQQGYPCTGQELAFHISPLSFYQVNPVQTEKLYSLALSYAGLTGRETVWDLYCGIGTISLFLAQKAGRVYGVEIIPQAIDDARENAIRNNLPNATFFVGKAEEVLPQFYEQQSANKVQNGPDKTGVDDKGNSDRKDMDASEISASNSMSAQEADMLHPDVIVVDPPRKGCDDACLSTMLKMAPSRIVYVSCDSATLSRDLKILCDGGYELKKVRGVDQFGHTVHVEVAVSLCRKDT